MGMDWSEMNLSSPLQVNGKTDTDHDDLTDWEEVNSEFLEKNGIILNDNEYTEAINLVSSAYKLGVDAIIIQDIGLALEVIKKFPDLPVHASTQMTVHNLDGVLELEKLGFSRCVLSRELPISEIEYICKNSRLQIR